MALIIYSLLVITFPLDYKNTGLKGHTIHTVSLRYYRVRPSYMVIIRVRPHLYTLLKKRTDLCLKSKSYRCVVLCA
jgi:hypothetical protein